LVTKGNILSNLWLGPASESLQQGDGKTRLLLNNGDLIPGSVHALREGKLSVESEAGNLEPAWKAVQSIVFDTPRAQKPAAARIFLGDGTKLNVDDFRYEHGELSAHSELLGELRFGPNALSELVFHPASTVVIRSGDDGASVPK
jgi:hypothetical protein